MTTSNGNWLAKNVVVAVFTVGGALLVAGVTYEISTNRTDAEWKGSITEIVEKVGPDVAALRHEIAALRSELFRQSDWERERRVIDAQLGRIEDKVDALTESVKDIKKHQQGAPR